MSISIFFDQFDKAKVDQVWDDIISGEYEPQARKEKERLEREVAEIKEKEQDHSPQDLDFMFYSKDPKGKEAFAILEEISMKERKAFELNQELIGLDELKKALASKDNKAVLDNIAQIDIDLIQKFSVKSFSEYYDPRFEEFSALLFKEVLGLDIGQVYAEQEGLPGIPFQVWADAFKNIDLPALANIKLKIESGDYPSDYNYDMFREYILPIRDVVKACLDTGTEMVITVEGGWADWQKERAKKIYSKILDSGKG